MSKPALIFNEDTYTLAELVSQAFENENVDVERQCWSITNGFIQPENKVIFDEISLILLIVGESVVSQEFARTWWQREGQVWERKGNTIGVVSSAACPKSLNHLPCFDFSQSDELANIVEFSARLSLGLFRSIVKKLLTDSLQSETAEIVQYLGIAADFAVSESGVMRDRILVRCENGDGPTQSEYTEFADEIHEQLQVEPTLRGLIICWRKPTYTEHSSNVIVNTLDQLNAIVQRQNLKNQADFDRQLFHRRIYETQHRLPEQHFARRSAVSHMPSIGEIPDVRSYLLDACRSDNRSLVIVFGDIGGGKTTQLQLLSEDLCEAFQNEPNPNKSARLPLRVELESYPGIYEQRVQGYLKKTFSERMHVVGRTWGEWKRDVEEFGYVLLLDGLDEIKTMYAKHHVSRQLRAILESLSNKTMCVITSRATIAESISNACGIVRGIIDKLNLNLDLKVISLNPVEPAEIETCLAKANKSPLLNSKFRGVFMDLCQRPLYLNFYAESEISNPSQYPKTESELVERAVNDLIGWRPSLHNTTGRELSSQYWRELNEDVALEMFRTNKRHISDDGIRGVVERWNTDRKLSEDDKLQIQYDLRVRTGLDMKDGPSASQRGFCFRHLAYLDFLAMHALARRMIAPTKYDSQLDGLFLSENALTSLRFALEKIIPDTVRHLRTRDLPKPPTKAHGMRMVWIPGGLGVVGDNSSPERDRGYIKNFTKGFWITRKLFRMRDLFNHHQTREAKGVEFRDRWIQDIVLDNPNRPRRLEHDEFVRNITVEEAVSLCQLSTGRLPTEAEWERAVGGLDCSKPTKNGSNIWGLDCSTDTLYQWTSDIDRHRNRNICKGGWKTRAMRLNKGNPRYRLLPTQPWHHDTGLRVVIDAC